MSQHSIDNQRASQLQFLTPPTPKSWSGQPCTDPSALWKRLRDMAEAARRDGQHERAKTLIEIMRLIAGGTP
jgi:hypothetical protein